MTAGFSVDTASVRSLADLKALSPRAVVKMSDEAIAARKQALEQTAPPPSQVKADNDPSNLYATITKDGSTIATLYRGGSIVTPNAVRVPDNLSMEGTGTLLADARISQMTAMYGGTVSYASQARLQSAATTAATLFAAQLAGR